MFQCCHTDFELEKKKFGKVDHATRPPLFFASEVNSRITCRYFKIQP